MKEKTLNTFTHLETQREKLVNSYNNLSEKQLQFKPESDHWNLLQVMRHLITSEKQSLIYIQRKITRHEEAPKAGVDSYLRHIILKLALVLPIKFKAPKIAEVKEDFPNFEEMKLEWDSIRSDLKDLIESSNDAILAKAIYRHPRAGMLNIKQAVEFLETHINHHQKQIQRIKNHPSFPANG